jgi:hypothetical protein
MMIAASLYETDFYAWAMHNAQLLREKRVNELDFEHLAEEIESVGASERKELQNRLEVLIAHLLKLGYFALLKPQNERGWRLTIREQRRRIKQCLKENPSLKSALQNCFENAFGYAIDAVIRQTGIDENVLPTQCPFTLENTLHDDFYP